MGPQPTGDLDIRPGVAAVLVDTGGQVLLHRRRVGRGWAPIFGHIEPGEPIQAAPGREVHEEIGLAITRERLVAVYSDPNIQIVTEPDGRRVHFVTCLFTATVAGGPLPGSDEGTDWDWFSPDQRPADLLPIKPLFRAGDLQAMQAWFDLGSYDHVRDHAGDILERVEEGDMPCDVPWGQDTVDKLRTWIEQGCPP